jgi:DNA-binding GntR family transcriptional regulator
MGLALDDSGYPDLEDVAREHQRLIYMIEAGDENAAAEAMTAHVLANAGYLMERIRGNPDDPVPAKVEAANPLPVPLEASE